MLLVHPEGDGSKMTNEELNISFATTPDYSGMAKAAAGGKCFTGLANTAEELDRLLPLAVEAVKSGICAVVDARVGGREGKYMPTREE